MKRVLLIICIMLFQSFVFAEDSFQLTAGVSVSEIPKEFFGSWRVNAKIEESNSYGTFKPVSTDMWTLSRLGDKVTLSNPFTGASSEISMTSVQGNLVVFTKKAPYDNKILTDTVTIRIDSSNFSGINDLKLESFSNVDNHLMKTETARYIIKGEKIAGENILEK